MCRLWDIDKINTLIKHINVPTLKHSNMSGPQTYIKAVFEAFFLKYTCAHCHPFSYLTDLVIVPPVYARLRSLDAC